MNLPLTSIVCWVGAMLMLCGCAGEVALAPTPRVVWDHTFEHPVQFHTVVDEELLLVGTKRHLYGLDRSNGALKWRERNVNPLRQEVYDVEAAD